MNKINTEFSKLFKEICTASFFTPTRDKKLIEDVRFNKQNRSIGTRLNDTGFYQIFGRYHNTLVAFYDAKDNSLVLQAGERGEYGTSPSTKDLLNSLCPQGYSFFSKNFEGHENTPEGVTKKGYVFVKNYIH